MSKILDALRRAEAARQGGGGVMGDDAWDRERPFSVLSVCSNKGGVGKTTIASNLAVYLRAFREDEPVLILGFDDQTTLDRMFSLEANPGAGDLAEGLRAQSLSGVTRFGQYGVDYVPSCPDVPALRALVGGPDDLRRILLASKRTGTVVIDTKSDFENLTRSAIEISDLSLVIVKDQASFFEAKRVFDLLEKAGRPRESARILLSLVDLRVKFREGEDADVLAHLLSEIRREQYPVFETFLSRSPKVESLYTNPQARAVAILQGAKQSLVHRQMIQLTQEVVRDLDATRPSLGAADSLAAAPGDDPTIARPSLRPALPKEGVVPPAAPNFRESLAARTATDETVEDRPRKGPRFWGGMTSRSNP